MIYMPFCMIREIWEVSDGSPERFEVPVSHLTTIIPEEGLPLQKLKKNKFVLKWFLGNFKCFKLMFFFKKKKKLTENWSAADPTHPP